MSKPKGWSDVRYNELLAQARALRDTNGRLSSRDIVGHVMEGLSLKERGFYTRDLIDALNTIDE